MTGKFSLHFSEATLVQCAALIAFAVLILLVATSPSQLIYDERYHIEGARLLKNGSGIVEMLSAPLPSAPGPLYPVLHYLFSPLSALAAPAIRFVNLLMLGAAITATAYLIKAIGKSDAVARASMLLALPVMWVTGGLALTEMPALLMATLSTAIVAVQVVGRPAVKPTGTCYGFFALAGITAGLAILGRQTYLPLLCIFAFLFARNSVRGPALLGFCLVLAMILPVFVIWGGLIPRSQAHMGGGVNVIYGGLAFAYLGFNIAILAPAFFAKSLKWLMPVALLMLLANTLFLGFEFRPFKTLVFSRLGADSSYFLALACGAAIMTSAILVLHSLLLQLWSRSRDQVPFVATTLTILTTLTSFGISNFSSRYLMAAFPFALIVTQPYFQPTKWAALRLLGGSFLGALSLMSYWRS